MCWQYLSWIGALREKEKKEGRSNLFWGKDSKEKMQQIIIELMEVGFLWKKQNQFLVC